MSLVSLQINEGVGLIRLNNPPDNGLTADVRTGLWEAISICESEALVGAVILMGGGEVFCTGPSIDDRAQSDSVPSLSALCSRIEACPKPVITGLHGKAHDAGCELVLASHYRLSEPDATLGFPAITQGVIPCGGATQRLPRLIGAKAALDLLLSGDPLPAGAAEANGLIDGTVQGNLQTACISLARDLAKNSAPTRETRAQTTGLADPAAFQIAVAEAQKRSKDSGLIAPERLIDCVAAAQFLPFEQGLAYEAEAHAELAASPEARALRYLAQAASQPQTTQTPAKITPIGITGAGARGAPLIAAALLAGLEVRMLEQDEEYLSEGIGRVHALLHQAQVEGRLSPEGRAEVEGRLTGASSVEDLGQVHFMVETLPDDSGRKPDLLAGLAEIVGPFGIVATLAETPSLEELSTTEATDERLIGLRFAGAAHQARMLEVIVQEGSGPAAAATGLAFADLLGLQATASRTALLPLLWRAMRGAVRHVAQTDAEQARLAAALTSLGFTRFPISASPEGSPSAAEAARLTRPLLLAMANAGADALMSGAAAGAMQVDLAAVHGLNFPRTMGGPMHWAEGQGLLRCRDDLAALADRYDSTLFAPSELFTEMGRGTGNFEGWGLQAAE
ncbi:enoyl-CoA hydratase/isomerase family protein [Alphaproteobacteria bacterium KMM 3653]|uniref:Enoyl-CoA hydratase/isomerase family protein n=1 Tax=Harenicola maris TaxID=2841044 RepID=A0AAP2CQW3_9RHOB|nr:enoyl-CoA hydratase/isomerase family protein [Harenicola maris]